MDDSQQILPSPVEGEPTVDPPFEKVANTTGIDGVIAYNTAGYPAPGTPTKGTVGHDHVPGPVTYSVVPPVGGAHNKVWANAGVYTKPIPSERGVHTMEHGAVWITYRPDLPAADVAALTEFVTRQSPITAQTGTANRFVLMSPWADGALPAPVVISSWGYQLPVPSAADPRLQKFVDTFRRSEKYSPEAATVDGVPAETGGQPATAGSVPPNPPGTAQG